MKRYLLLFFVLFAWQPFPAKSEEVPGAALTEPGFFDYKILKPRVKRKSTYWHPLGSLFVPGLAQFSNGQYGAGFVYAGAGAFGLGLAIANMEIKKEGESSSQSGNLSDLTDKQKAVVWGSQLYQTAGSLSTYHAFRSVVEQRQADGAFQFLKVKETNDELMLAPFHFSHLLRPTTFIPLGILALSISQYYKQDNVSTRPLSGSDHLFAAGISYNAGVGEEALFRGYMMMNLRQSWNSDFLSNAATASVFALAHLSPTNTAPWPQLLLGYYLGWMTQANQWTLSESIFLHTWWDVIAISAALAEKSTNVVWLPFLNFTF